MVRRLLVTLTLLAAACSVDGERATPSSAPSSTVAPTTVSPASTIAPATTVPPTSTASPPTTALRPPAPEAVVVAEAGPDGIVRVSVPAGMVPVGGSSAAFIAQADGPSWRAFTEEAGRAWSWVATLTPGQDTIEFEPPSALWRSVAYDSADPHKDPIEVVARPAGRFEIRLGAPSPLGDLVGVVDLPSADDATLDLRTPTPRRDDLSILRGGAIGDLEFGAPAEAAIEILTGWFGRADHDTGYRDGCVGPNRVLSWSSLGLRVSFDAEQRSDPDAQPLLTGWEVDLIGDGGTQRLATPDGIRPGMPMAAFAALVRPVFGEVDGGRLGTRLFDSDDGMGGLLDGDVTDPMARVIVLASPSPVGSC